jgi:serine O-acetyltransferase
MVILIQDIKAKQRLYENDGSRHSLLRIALTDGTAATLLYRLTCFFNKYKLLKPIAFITQWINKLLFGCVIGIGTTFDEGLILAHPIGVVMNSKVKGGKNIVIESGVVIGDEKGCSPVLGDNIFIGAGAKVIGGITIGDNVKIGANAVVVKDVPGGSTVVGIPGRIIK